jgi:hypothetical protein
MNETLLEQVKRKLNITWEDADTNNRVLDIIAQATAVMLHKIGITDEAFDFSKSGIENILFLAYCLYLYNHCENEFDTNYLSDILQARGIHEVSQNEDISKVQ